MKLSVIIPVYNVENYIQQCLESLIRQDLDYREYELIIVNDGSPDNSENIIKQYIASAGNIVYIKQDNAGVSVARNRGLDIAKGKYILFVDPDDSIRQNTLKKIVAHAEQTQSDVMYLKIDVYQEDGKFVAEYPPCGEDNVVAQGFLHPRRTFPATLYLRDLIVNLRFVPDVKRGQDTVFNIMAHSMAKRVTYYSLPFYKYLLRADSSKQFVRTEGVFYGCMLAIKELLKFEKDYFPNQGETQKKYFDDAILIFLERILQWSVIPSLSYKRFFLTRKLAFETNRWYLIDKLSSDYKFVNKNYLLFYSFHCLSRLKGSILKWP